MSSKTLGELTEARRRLGGRIRFVYGPLNNRIIAVAAWPTALNYGDCLYGLLRLCTWNAAVYSEYHWIPPRCPSCNTLWDREALIGPASYCCIACGGEYYWDR